MPSMPGSARLWLAACSAAAVLLLSTVLLLQRRAAAPRPQGPQAPLGCAVAEALPARPLPGAEDPPVLLWAAGSVRMAVDGSPAFSPPEAPKRFAVGEHAVRVEAFGAEPLSVRLRFDPFRPALLHAQVEAGVGITLVHLGAVCAGCESAVTGVELSPSGANRPPEPALAAAASALRTMDWRAAAAALRDVGPSGRKLPAFHRLAAGVYAATARPQAARDELDALPEREAKDLKALLARLDELAVTEAAREREVVLTRWNRLTERFGAMVKRFERTVPGPVQAAAARLEELSRAFEEASRRRDVTRQEELFVAGEQALMRLVRELRQSRPDDCTFQADVVSTLLR